jgi:hypothetical protein
MTSRRGLALAWIVWFVVLNVLWLWLISAFVFAETILGLFAAALGATAAVAVQSQNLIEFRLRPRWLLGVFGLPWRTLRETVTVHAALARKLFGGQSGGRFRTVPVSLPEDPAESAGKRALLIAGESFAPNGYVLGIDEERGLMLIHELAADPDE